MRSIIKMFIVINVLLCSVSNHAQIKNEKTESVKIYGKCDICKKKIEQVGNINKIVNVVWDQKSQMAVLNYDKNKTNREEILKRIALAGYDNEIFLAPDDVYMQLPECCRYERVLKYKNKETKMHESLIINSHHKSEELNLETEESVINTILNGYFAIKDALVKTDAATAATKAIDLNAVLKTVNEKELYSMEQNIWNKVSKNLIIYAGEIAKNEDISKQRIAFTLLSTNLYQLIKTVKHSVPVYYQHCPMYNNGKGANWLSKNSTVRNPYYGSKMISCGSTTEILN